MKKSRFRTEQIIGIVKEHEAGMKAPDLARKHGVSERTIYRWRSKYGGMSVPDATRLKALEDENRHTLTPGSRATPVTVAPGRSVSAIASARKSSV